MPVKALGKKVIEISTGKMKAKAKSKRNAAITASIINRAIKFKGDSLKKTLGKKRK